MLNRTMPGDIRRHAGLLGVSAESLERLGAVLYQPSVLAFPMRRLSAGELEIVGIRLRAASGKKWAIPGSRAGLFIADDGPGDLVATVYLPEGPTDCAALLTAGVYAIGRHSCAGGADDIAPFVQGRLAVVVADYDQPKPRPDGTTWRPGMDGAKDLAATLARSGNVRSIVPAKGKDAREWLRQGMTARQLETLVKHARPIGVH
jgi:hypothetical protein